MKLKEGKWVENNKDKAKIYYKRYRDKNRDKIKEKRLNKKSLLTKNEKKETLNEN